MIESSSRSKRVGEFAAIRQPDLVVPAGQLFGVLDPNGAGLTATTRLIAGMRQPTAGSIRIAGHDRLADPLRAKRAIGRIGAVAVLSGRPAAQWVVAAHASPAADPGVNVVSGSM